MSAKAQSTISNQDERYIFEVGLEDVSTMNKVLHELHHSDDHSVLVVDKEGLRLITNGEKTFQISAFFAASTFHKFDFDFDLHEYINFRFILKEFIECLNLLRDDTMEDKDRLLNMDDLSRTGETMKTSLEIVYRKRGDPLRLKLENSSNCVINCELKAFNLVGDSMFSHMAFGSCEDIAVIVFDSKKLYDYISGIDLVTCDFVDLRLQQCEVPVKISTKSTQLGEVELEISSEETSVIKRELRVSNGCQFSFSYRTQFIKPALDALKFSTHMKLKCGSSGLLCIEHFHGVRDVNKSDGPFIRPVTADTNSDGYIATSQHSLEYMTDYNHPQRKRSSVEYFILSEAKPVDACDVLD